MNISSKSELTIQKNIYGMIFLLYSVTYIASHATAIFALKGVANEILHYSGEVILILCAVGYEAFSRKAKSGDGVRDLWIFARITFLYWLGCEGIALNALLLIVSIATGRCEK